MTDFERVCSNITYDGIHSVLSGKYILLHINRTKSRYIEEERIYNGFEIIPIVDLMLCDNQFKIASDLIKLTRLLFHTYKDKTITECMYLHSLEHLDYRRIELRTVFYNELFLYDLIKRDISVLIPSAVVVDFHIIQGHIPDLMIELDGEMCPVEVKKSNINKSALDQLRRYLRVYNCKKGFLMGTKLSTVIEEDHITFIDISHLRDMYFPQE